MKPIDKAKADYDYNKKLWNKVVQPCLLKVYAKLRIADVEHCKIKHNVSECFDVLEVLFTGNGSFTLYASFDSVVMDSAIGLNIWVKVCERRGDRVANDVEHLAKYFFYVHDCLGQKHMITHSSKVKDVNITKLLEGCV